MSRTGRYLGGHSIIKPGSDWFGYDGDGPPPKGRKPRRSKQAKADRPSTPAKPKTRRVKVAPGVYRIVTLDADGKPAAPAAANGKKRKRKGAKKKGAVKTDARPRSARTPSAVHTGSKAAKPKAAKRSKPHTGPLPPPAARTAATRDVVPEKTKRAAELVRKFKQRDRQLRSTEAASRPRGRRVVHFDARRRPVAPKPETEE